MVKSEVVNPGVALVERLTGWIGSYMAMPADYSYLMAIWVIHTWVFDQFDSTPYVSITGDGPGTGKTTLLKVASFLSRNPLQSSSSTPAALLWAITEKQGHLTLALDESEALGREAQSLVGQLANSGYSKGDTILKRKPGGGNIEYQTYCPKLFAGIGDLRDTLRSRSLVFRLQAGTPSRTFYRAAAMGEAQGLVAEIKSVLGSIPSISVVEPAHLVERQREIWTPLFSVASMLGCDLERLTRISTDMYAEFKTIEKRRAVAVIDDEGQRIDREFAPKALRDWLRVVEDGEEMIWTGVAIERMKLLADGPWRRYRGDGLNEMGLAALFARYDGLQKADQFKRFVKDGKIVKRNGPGVEQANRRGYRVADVRQAAKAAGVVL